MVPSRNTCVELISCFTAGRQSATKHHNGEFIPCSKTYCWSSYWELGKFEGDGMKGQNLQDGHKIALETVLFVGGWGGG